MRKHLWYALAMCSLMLCSCKHLEQLKHEKLNADCEKSIKEYNKLLRWREVENAGMLFIDRSMRDDFVKRAEDIKKREVVITDYRFLTTECQAEKSSAEAAVEFDYYVLPSNRLKTVVYRQKWKYVDTAEAAGWLVTTPLPDFE